MPSSGLLLRTSSAHVFSRIVDSFNIILQWHVHKSMIGASRVQTLRSWKLLPPCQNTHPYLHKTSVLFTRIWFRKHNCFRGLQPCIRHDHNFAALVSSNCCHEVTSPAHCNNRHSCGDNLAEKNLRGGHFLGMGDRSRERTDKIAVHGHKSHPHKVNVLWKHHTLEM